MKKTSDQLEDDDEDTPRAWAPITDIAQFAKEKREALAQARAEAHAEVDRVFDACLVAFEADIVQIGRDVAAGALEAPARH